MQKESYIPITTTLKTAYLRYDYIIVCEDIKPIIVPVKDDKFGDMVQRQIELIKPVEYAKEDLAKKVSLNTKVIKWVDTYTLDGKEAMAVVLEKGA